MLGEIVTHTRFGAGRVTGFAPPRIEITFDDGAVRAFPYPDAVGKFLRFEGDQARQQARQDRDCAEVSERERTLARLAENRRRAEEEHRRCLEAIREKKVAAARRSAARSALARKAKEGEK